MDQVAESPCLESFALPDFSMTDFPQGARVVDVGCGRGRFLRQLHAQGCRAVGIEPDPAKVEELRRDGLRAEVSIAEKLPLEDGAYDGLVCSVVLQLTDERIFEYPFMFMQQPGRGNWRPTAQEAANLREYLLRGGFLLVDDLHGEYDWAVFQAGMRRVFPDRPIIDIPADDPLMHIFYDLDERTAIPGERHLRFNRSGQIVAQMEGPPRWRGIYDDNKHLMVAIDFNIDMGDAWEHADDPYYQVPMTALAYKLGINYVIYAMTH